MQNVTVKHCPPLRVAAIRHIGPYPQIGSAFERIAAFAGQGGLFQRPGGAMMLGLYYDDPMTTPAEELRSDACVTVDEAFEGDEGAGVSVRSVPGGEFAAVVHTGPYEGLPDAWQALAGTWLPSSGRVPAMGGEFGRPCCEVYLNSCFDRPQDLQTELRLPLEPE